MILIVDDHIDTGTILSRLLKKCGHEAVAVSSGPAALKVLETARPAVIVLDMMMPEMHGLEVLQRVRADAKVNDVPVIVYSADGAAQTVRQAREQGTQEFVVKGVVPWDRLCDNHHPVRHGVMGYAPRDIAAAAPFPVAAAVVAPCAETETIGAKRGRGDAAHGV